MATPIIAIPAQKTVTRQRVDLCLITYVISLAIYISMVKYTTQNFPSYSIAE